MTEERGEIIFKLLKAMFIDEMNLRVENMKIRLEEVAKETGVPYTVVKQEAKELMQECSLRC